MDTVKLGDIVVFHHPHEPSDISRVAIVIEVYKDETVDLCCFNGYAHGTTDFHHVAPADLELASEVPEEPPPVEEEIPPVDESQPPVDESLAHGAFVGKNRRS